MAFKQVAGGTRIRPDRNILAIWAEEKKGKSHFALSAPGPIYYFDFDRGVDELVHKFPGKNLNIATYKFDPANKDPDHAQEIYNEFTTDLTYVINAAVEGTVVIDTWTHVWNLIQSVFLDRIRKTRKSGEVFPFDYGEANKHAESIVNRIKDNQFLNLCLICRAKETYNEKGQRTGQSEMAGQKDTPYMVQAVLRLDKERIEGQGIVHKALVQSCRDNENIEGLVIPNADWSTVIPLFG